MIHSFQTQLRQTLILPVEQVPVEQVPVEQVPVEQVPVEQVPVEQVPVEQVPVERVTYLPTIIIFYGLILSIALIILMIAIFD